MCPLGVYLNIYHHLVQEPMIHVSGDKMSIGPLVI